MTGHPEIDAILDRAQRYRHEVYARDGVRPETFLVTEREYDLLQTYRAPSWVAVNVDTLSDITPRPMSLFGMRVVQPERFERARDSTHGNPRPSSLTLAALERAFAFVLEQSSSLQTLDPLPSRAIDSERSSLEEWTAAVDALLAEVHDDGMV
jgi:hypothetical protein